jgi:hypothetical protein
MSRKSRLQDARVAKDKRAKRMAIGGAVVLAALLAWELPHYIGGHKTAAPAATTSTNPVGTPGSPATTVPGAAAPAVLPTAKTRLPNSDVAPIRSRSELFSFDRFASKDPFKPQATASSAAASPSTGTPTSNAPTTPSGGSLPTTGGSGSKAPTLATAHAAMIAVNGKSNTVIVGATFPSSNPLFRLVSIGHNAAKIGLVNGTFASGAHTVTLAVGQSIVLIDKADNAHYNLQLLTVS